MNKTTLKMLGCFIGGLGIGGGAGYFITVKMLKNKYDEQLSIEIDDLERKYADSISEKYRREVNPIDEKEDQNESDDEDYERMYASEDMKEIRKKLKKNWDGTTNYAKMYEHKDTGSNDPAEDEYPSEDYDDDRTEEDEKIEDAYEYHQKNKSKDPTIISIEDFGNLPPHIDHKVLYYYEGDEQMVTEEDELIDDPANFIGNALTKYGFDHNNEERIFVMNYAQDTCYEVQKMWGEYGTEEDV